MRVYVYVCLCVCVFVFVCFGVGARLWLTLGPLGGPGLLARYPGALSGGSCARPCECVCAFGRCGFRGKWEAVRGPVSVCAFGRCGFRGKWPTQLQDCDVVDGKKNFPQEGGHNLLPRAL